MQTLLFWISKLVNPLLSPLTLAILVPAVALLSARRREADPGTTAPKKADSSDVGSRDVNGNDHSSPTGHTVHPWRFTFPRRKGRTAPTSPRPVLQAVALALLGCLYLLSAPLVSNLLVSLWEPDRSGPETLALSEKAPFDAIIVLGGSVAVELSEGWRIATGRSMERLTDAARLYRELAAAGKPPFVIVTGGSGNPAFQARAEAPFMQELLVLMGVPESAIIREGASRNTWENALYTKTIMEENGFQSAVLVTSALHMRRSQAIFAKQGYRFEPFTVDTSRHIAPFPNFLLPDTESLNNSYQALREMAGFVAYRLMGRL